MYKMLILKFYKNIDLSNFWKKNPLFFISLIILLGIGTNFSLLCLIIFFIALLLQKERRYIFLIFCLFFCPFFISNI